ncbi:MAG: hypothetical protein ACLUOI_30895 [Eisenbergiella sp.]
MVRAFEVNPEWLKKLSYEELKDRRGRLPSTMYLLTGEECPFGMP